MALGENPPFQRSCSGSSGELRTASTLAFIFSDGVGAAAPVAASGLPHFGQKVASAGTSVLQAVQSMGSVTRAMRQRAKCTVLGGIRHCGLIIAEQNWAATM